MILEQHYLGCLAQASYFIADEESGVAAVVDPRRDVDAYLEAAEQHGVEIRHVLLTHFHADFVAGHLELRERVGATIHLGAQGEAEYDCEPLADGTELRLGPRVRLRALETPGHTPESVCLLVFDEARDPERPHAVLTGDTLFIGDVGRPDLMASVGVTAEELASSLYDSLHEKLLPLPDETLVYPGHGAGSACGRSLSTDTVSTIGEQRRYNYALQPMTREQFVRAVTADQPDAPRYFALDARLNRQERQTLEASLERGLQALSVAEVLRLRNAGAQLVDVREPAEFAGGHLSGSVNIGLSGKFASWAGSLLDQDRAIVLVGEPGQEQEAAMRLGRVGFDRVAGFLEGGLEALRSRPELVERTDRMTAQALAEWLGRDGGPTVVDVRTCPEWAEGHVEGSVNLPLARLQERADELPRDRPLVLVCASGYRSSIAASLLRRQGFDGIWDLVGGMEAWRTVAEAGASS